MEKMDAKTASRENASLYNTEIRSKNGSDMDFFGLWGFWGGLKDHGSSIIFASWFYILIQISFIKKHYFYVLTSSNGFLKSNDVLTYETFYERIAKSLSWNKTNHHTSQGDLPNLEFFCFS